MTTEEEYHSLKETYKLLCMLLDPKRTQSIQNEGSNPMVSTSA